MEKLEQLQKLRHAAERVLDELHRLPDFDDRLRAIAITPGRVSGWQWSAISRALAAGDQDLPPGVPRWERVAEEDLRKEAMADPEIARYLKRIEDEDRWSIDGSDQRFAQLYRDVPPLSQEERVELALYAQQVRTFVRRYVFNVAWGPAAVHDALRSQGRLVLPPAVPLPWMTSDTDVSIEVRAGDPIAPREIELIRRFLLEVKEHPEHARLAEEKRRVRAEGRAAYEQLPGGKDRLGKLDEAQQVMAPTPPSSVTSEFSGSATNAVACIRAKLEGRDPTSAEKRAVSRTRVHLEAALNPRSDLLPLQLLDDAERRQTLNQGAKVLYLGYRHAGSSRHDRHEPQAPGEPPTDRPSR